MIVLYRRTGLMRTAIIQLLTVTTIVGFIQFYYVRATNAATAVRSLVIVPYNFGDRPAGTVVHLHVPIRNPLPKVVLIKDIQTSCGCTSAKPASWKVTAGGADDIAVRINSLSVGGTFDGTVLIVGHTAAALPIVWRIDLAGKFITSSTNLLTIPRSINLGYPTPGKRLFQMVRLERNGLVDLGKVKAIVSAPWIKVVYDSWRSNSMAAEYKVIIRPPQGSGSFHEEIRFQGAESGDFIRLPISGHTVPLIGVVPDKVLLMPGQQVYPLLICAAAGGTATLQGYRIQSHGIKVVSVRESKRRMDGKPMLKADALPTSKGFISATLFLRFKQWNKPVKVMFVGMGQ